jgi:ABC-type transporter Mla subunit MlaD
MAASRRSENIRAGIFVLASITLAFFIILTLAGVRQRLAPAKTYIVRYSLAEGATGLQEGSEVRVGGRNIGIVSAVRLTGDNPEAPSNVDVTIRVSKDILFHSDAVGLLERPLLGSNSVINFTSLGGGDGSTTLTNGAVIQGAIAAPSFLAQAGYGAEQQQQLQDIFARADSLTERLDRLTAQFETDTMPLVNDGLADFREIAADARERSGEWFDRVDVILADVESASKTATSSIDEARSIIAEIDSLISDNRESIDTSIANVETASAQLNDMLTRLDNETVDALNGLLADGRAGVDDARATIDQVSTLLSEQSPEIRRTLANTRLASDQLRLTMGEVRRSPWRLLYRPNQKELEFELLYDATRAYASAVSDLRAATEALEAVSASGAEQGPDGEPIQGMLTNMTEAFTRYEAAEKRFLELLGQRAP